jgi:hypothetical protein
MISIKLQQSIAWAKSFLKYRPLDAGQNGEPALSSANTILQTILSPPFSWRWNRSVVKFTTEANQPDYAISCPNLGFIELATVDGFEMAVEDTLAAATETDRPRFISTVLDNGSGEVTFRLTPCPDDAYPVVVTAQNAAPLMTSTLSTWGPIPDSMIFVPHWGFLSMMAIYCDDPRAPMFAGKFVSTLLSVSEGLKEEDKALFAEQWLSMSAQAQVIGQRTSQGAEARGNL